MADPGAADGVGVGGVDAGVDGEAVDDLPVASDVGPHRASTSTPGGRLLGAHLGERPEGDHADRWMGERSGKSPHLIEHGIALGTTATLPTA